MSLYSKILKWLLFVILFCVNVFILFTIYSAENPYSKSTFTDNFMMKGNDHVVVSYQTFDSKAYSYYVDSNFWSCRNIDRNYMSLYIITPEDVLDTSDIVRNQDSYKGKELNGYSLKNNQGSDILFIKDFVFKEGDIYKKDEIYGLLFSNRNDDDSEVQIIRGDRYEY